MKRDEINIKCNIKNCFNNEKEKCSEFIPTIVKKLKPNEKTCPYFVDTINIKCNIKNCFNNEKEKCSEFLPTIVKKLKPNEKTCPYFEDTIINIKLREQLKHKKPQYDEALSDDQVEKIEKAKKRAQANMKKKAQEKDGTAPVKTKPKSKLSKFIE